MTDKEYKDTVMQISDRVMRFLVKNLRSSRMNTDTGLCSGEYYEDARDILQDSLITLWNNKTDVEFAKAKSYLFTVAYRNMLNVLKQTKIRTDRIKEMHNFHDAKAVGRETDYDNKQLINRAMEQLPENMRSCLLLKDWEGYKTSEISQITGISEQNVKITLFRARKKLREILKDM
ncbi:MAG: RNA polymerase sigma factor [Bacteroidales bacterium]|nr:RNA polymerase sigma factor [Bacteroidales bacterium]